MKWLMNSRRDIVEHALEGLVLASGGQLKLLDGFPQHRVVVASDWKKDRVALISGGGSGHEPAHAGFVGEGMLAAAVAGDVFASPSVDAVLQAIAAVTGDAGCLLIVKNYTGDRLNFGLAAEKAKALGYKVEMVIVGDDVALPDNPQPRGVAGTLFVHKIAGALAASSAELEKVAALAQRVAAATSTFSVSLGTCSIPGVKAERVLDDDKVEFGLGIHGEPGVRTASFEAVDALVTEIAQTLHGSGRLGDQRIALMVNNLGGLTDLEMLVATRALAATDLWRHVDLLIGPGKFMSALDMRGMSVSTILLSDELRQGLQAPTGCRNWLAPLVPERQEYAQSLLAARDQNSATPSDGLARIPFRKMLDALVASEEALNAADAQVGDGDTGSTIAQACRTLLEREGDLPFAGQAALFNAVGNVLSAAMGGSSGVLLAIFCSSAGTASAEGAGYPDALLAGLDAVKRYGGAKPGDRTMVDALEPALIVLSQGGSIADAARAAREGAERTRLMDKALAGRSAYLNTKSLQGNVDPGSEAVARAFEALTK